MAKRIEQSRRHGHYDPRWAKLALVPHESSRTADELEEPARKPPTLTLVGGTDLTPTPVKPRVPLGI